MVGLLQKVQAFLQDHVGADDGEAVAAGVDDFERRLFGEQFDAPVRVR